MFLKDFLDYLCSLNFAQKRERPVKKSTPQYQNQNSYQQKDTTFIAREFLYTIHIPSEIKNELYYVAERDNTYVAPHLSSSGKRQKNLDEKLMSAIEDFFINLNTFLIGSPQRQKGGIVFTSRFGGYRDPIKDKADYPDRYPVNIDELLLLAGVLAPVNDLYLAQALNNLKDILSLSKELKRENEVRKKMNEQLKKNKTEIEKKTSEIEKKIRDEQVDLNIYQHKNKKKQEYFHLDEKESLVISKNNTGHTTINNDTTVLKEKIHLLTASEETIILGEDGSPILHWNKGDTVTYQIIKILKNGSYFYGNTEFYHKNSGILDKYK